MTASPSVELLAPAGDERALRAALAAGADAVYFGLERWSARAFAGNFTGEQVVRAVDLAHRYGARAYLALNTRLKDDEIGPALTALEAPYAAGLDALIVADLGFATLVRERFPDLPLHASTQLNTHSSSQLAALALLGFRRAILARELSLDEIAALEAHGLELEAFVHGALCYGYSGDCLLSSMVGGRSGNRGRCSQSCRMRYRLGRVVGHNEGRAPSGRARRDGPEQPAAAAQDFESRGDFDRVLSTGDLCAIGALPALAAAGVSSFKIEGRMKDEAYVAVTTAVYREALDAALADPGAYVVRPEWLEHLEQSFSRGFTTAHLDGMHDEVRSGGRGGHRGVLVGRVASVDEARGEVVVRLSKPVAAGDAVYLYTPWGQSDLIRVHVAATDTLTLPVRDRVAVKDRLFRLSAASAGELARDLAGGRRALRPVRLRMCLVGEEGRPAALAVEPVFAQAAEAGTADLSVTVVSTTPLAAARTAALDEGRARDALGALGGTPYRLEELEFLVPEGLFLAVSELKDLRRRAVSALDERRLAARRRTAVVGLTRLPGGGRAGADGGAAAAVSPAVRTDPVRARGSRDVVLRLRPGETPLVGPDVGALCLDILTDDPVDVIAAARATLASGGLPVRCRLPEVLFDADAGWLANVLALRWDVAYVRHLGSVDAAQELPLALEYPLQGLNGLAPAVLALLTGNAPAAVVASPEASLEEIAALHAAVPVIGPPPALEALAFGREQVLYTRDRLGRAEGLVEAPSPAEHVRLLLEDAKGYVFPAQVDHGGTRLFNARLTNLAANLDELRDAGVTRFLVVQSDLSADEGRAFASGGLPALAAFVSRERTTTGHLFRGVT